MSKNMYCATMVISFVFEKKCVSGSVGGVRKACAEREMGLGKARGMCRDRNEWRGV